MLIGQRRPIDRDGGRRLRYRLDAYSVLPSLSEGPVLLASYAKVSNSTPTVMANASWTRPNRDAESMAAKVPAMMIHAEVMMLPDRSTARSTPTRVVGGPAAALLAMLDD